MTIIYNNDFCGERNTPNLEMSQLSGCFSISSEMILPVPGARVIPCRGDNISVESEEESRERTQGPWAVAR